MRRRKEIKIRAKINKDLKYKRLMKTRSGFLKK
jgi:hypothetical protein